MARPASKPRDPRQTMIDRSLQTPSTPACAPRWRRWATRLRAEGGFTLIEALVATMVLTVGLLTTFMMLTIATHQSADVRAREGAVTLARQITEDARSIPYSQISGSTIVSTLQAMPGLANSSSGSSWTIVRNGFTYTVTAGVTSVSDTKDSSGATDFEQVTATVTWTTFQGKTQSVTETTTLSRAGQDPGLIASNLALDVTWPTAGISGSTTAPVITSNGITSLQFQVTAPSGTTAIVWSLNGGKQSSWAGSAPSSGNTWVSNVWSLPAWTCSPSPPAPPPACSGVSDGTYTIGAQAEDSNGVDGPAVTIPVRLIRTVPTAPNVTGYGFNSNFMVSGQPTTVADIQWNPNSELNVIGYRVYSPSGTMICQTSTTSFSSNCGANAWCSGPTACVDLNPPSTNASNLTYSVRALYYDSNNNLQAGTATSVTLASGTPSPPPPVPVVSLGVVTQPDNTGVITWTPPVGGTPVSFYRIYRDGDNYTDRYDTVAASTCSVTCTYHDTGRTSGHSYYVTAVGGTTAGADMAESQATGPVTG
jgi:Tfp pilus assembly protein PilV